MKDKEYEIQAEEVPTCFLCGNLGIPLYRELQDSLFGSPGDWDFLRCSQCGLAWLNPRLIPQDIKKHYTKYYQYAQSDIPTNYWTFLKSAIKTGVLTRYFGYKEQYIKKRELLTGLFLSWISPLREIVGRRVMWLKMTKENKRLLDVGSGSGCFLAQMRDFGWEVEGIEPNPTGVRIARQSYGLDKVYEGNLKEIYFPDEYFDVITMHHVIEHLTNPIETLNECSRILKSKGRIVIVTPNIESLVHRLFGRFWASLDPPRHIYIFSQSTLKDCILQSGLKIEYIQTLACDANSVWQISNFIKRNNLNKEKENIKIGVTEKSSISDGSYLIKQEGIFYKIPELVSASSYLSGFIFYILEYVMNKVFSCGEEILVIAIK